MTTTSLGTAIVTARPGALDAAIDRNRTSIRHVAAASGVSKSTISNVAARTGYGIAKEKAVRVAEALGVPVGDLFVHRDGAPLA